MHVKEVKMGDRPKKVLNDYIKKSLIKGFSKGQIQAALEKSGYDAAYAKKEIQKISSHMTARKILVPIFTFGFFVILVIATISIFKTSTRPEIAASAPLSIIRWTVTPSDAKLNEPRYLEVFWEYKQSSTSDYKIVLALLDKRKSPVESYFFETKLPQRMAGVKYTDLFEFKVDYLKPGFYYYKIGILDKNTSTYMWMDEKNFGSILIEEELHN